jgi:hypothetical protein
MEEYNRWIGNPRFGNSIFNAILLILWKWLQPLVEFVNSGNAGAYIRCSMDDGNSWTYITPEPYIERINLDWVTTSGNSSDELKAMYSVNRPMVKFSEISYDLSTLGGTYPSSSEKPSGKK